MSEYELLEAISTAGDKLSGGSMNFVAIFFAYLVAAHFVGGRLKKIEAVFLSLIYSLYQFSPASASVGGAIRMVKLSERYNSEFPASDLVNFPSIPLMVTLTLAPLILGWLVSLYYMHGVVRRAA